MPGGVGLCPAIVIAESKDSIMFADYLRGAMRQAKYEIVQDDGCFYGENHGFRAYEPSRVV